MHLTHRIFAAAIGTLIWSLALVAQASLISNGDFETVTSTGSPASFAGWNGVGQKADASTFPSVISGTYSAELRKSSTTSYLQQTFSGARSDFAFDMDFAVFPAADSNPNRTMNVLLYYRESPSSNMVNMRIGADNQLSVVGNNSWQNIGSLTAIPTIDTGISGVWDGETPTINHLTILGHFNGSSPYYDVTLNGQTVTDLEFFQGPVPSGTDNFVRTVRLQSGYSDSNWLADNVTIAAVPEPTLLVSWLGLVGVGLLGWMRRRRS